jgi:hypothetical protein
MRIHTDNLTPDDIREAATLAGCNVKSWSTHRSTARGYAFEFILSGHGKIGGQYGNTSYASGSWDDYGIVLNRLFRRDPRAVVGTPGRPTYDGAADLHDRTAYRYESLTADQAHHAHKRDRSRWGEWVTDAGDHLTPCRKCPAYI